MKFLFELAIASLILLCDQIQGAPTKSKREETFLEQSQMQLQKQSNKDAGSLLEKKYHISGPEYHYDSWTFTMDFAVSDFMDDNMIAYTLHEGHGCKNGGKDITENEGYLLSRIRTDNTPNGNGSSNRTIKLTTQIVPSMMKGTGIYTDYQDLNITSYDEDDSDESNYDEDGSDESSYNEGGVVQYCVRMSNYNAERGKPHAMEINFLEVRIKLSIELSTGFGVNPFLETIEAVGSLATEGVAVEAYLCDREDNIVPMMPTNQGQTVRVCVTPTAEVLNSGFVMNRLEKFSFRREIPTSLKQIAIEPETGGVPADDLTVISCRPGYTICAFETLLTADFFVDEGTIAGTGSTYLQFADEGSDGSETERRLSRYDDFLNEPTMFHLGLKLVPLEKIGMKLATSSAQTAEKRFKVSYLIAIVLTLSTLYEIALK